MLIDGKDYGTSSVSKGLARHRLAHGQKAKEASDEKAAVAAAEGGAAAGKPSKSKTSSKPKVVEDLLGLDWGGAAPAATPAAPAPSASASEVPGKTEKADKADKKSKGSKSASSSAAATAAGGGGKTKKSSSLGWIPCVGFSDRHIELLYACMGTSPTTIAVSLRAVNRSADGAVVTVDASAIR